MNYGPLIFLAAFFALSASWFGLILKPSFQLGQLQQTNTVGVGAAYPVARSGLAQQGLQVYRANGCGACHSQQIGQEGYFCEILLSDAGTNPVPLMTELRQMDAKLSEQQARDLIRNLPRSVLQTKSKASADDAAKRLLAVGAKARVVIVPTGPDISRGWGQRRTVAEDYLYDDPVQPGASRIGPDLANVGARIPDLNWHLRHVYAPGSEVKKSIMPPYRYLFQTRKAGRQPSPDALALPPGFVPAGFEVVPRPESIALAAYLVSLHSDAPLFSTPMPGGGGPAAVATTNAPLGTTSISTNVSAQ